MKKIKKMIALLLILCSLTFWGCIADGATTDNSTLPHKSDVSSRDSNSPKDVVPKAKTALLYCVDDNSFLFRKNINERIYPASMTKLLTAYVALQYADADDVFKVGTEQALVHEGSSLCNIQIGNRINLYDLITGLLLLSGNDAAYTIAVGVARKNCNEKLNDVQAVEYFCDLMNSTAEELGMTNSHFTTPDGWDDDEQYTTASDLLKITRRAIRTQEISQIIKIKKKEIVFESGEHVQWKNHVELINSDSKYYCSDFVGGKTGTTDNAGHCLISAFKKEQKTYIAVVTGCKKDDERYSESLALYEYIR